MFRLTIKFIDGTEETYKIKYVYYDGTYLIFKMADLELKYHPMDKIWKFSVDEV